MNRAILVLGAQGQVAREIGKIADHHGVEPTFLGRASTDLAFANPGPILDELQPDAVINAAAYTAVDRAEQEPAIAFALNADMPGWFARACAQRGMPLVHISTDYVFDGSKPAPYLEDDPLAPLGVYGASKAAGEGQVRAAGGNHAIVRTAWVYSAFGANFVKTMLRVAGQRDEVSVVDDQRGCPTWAEDVARSCLLLAGQLIKEDERARGVFHAAGAGESTWAGFAAAIFAESAQRGGPTAAVRPIATADYPTPAARPANSRLAGTRLEDAVGWRPPLWTDQLPRCLAELLR